MAYDYSLLRVAVTDQVLVATIDNPPINLLSFPLMLELVDLGDRAAADQDVRVVVLRSDNADFFIAHFDVVALLAMPVDGEAVAERSLNVFHSMCERYRTMPKATIACIAGRVGGGGSELAASLDMRFGAIDRTIVNQMEVAIGILPGGGGTQRLARLVGRGRALEIILGSDDLDAVTAERWGYLNRALPADELDAFVHRLAARIASFPPSAVALAKESVLAAEPPWEAGLLHEQFLFARSMRTDAAQTRMAAFLERGGQTVAGERRVGDLCAELAPTS
jgi:enoyl-CoA hydratase/carnithine racemase